MYFYCIWSGQPWLTTVIIPFKPKHVFICLSYLGSPGGRSSAQRGAGARRVHGAVLRHIQGSVQIINVHQRIQVLGLGRWQHMGLDSVNFTQLGDERRRCFYWSSPDGPFTLDLLTRVQCSHGAFMPWSFDPQKPTLTQFNNSNMFHTNSSPCWRCCAAAQLLTNGATLAEMKRSLELFYEFRRARTSPVLKELKELKESTSSISSSFSDWLFISELALVWIGDDVILSRCS